MTFWRNWISGKAQKQGRYTTPSGKTLYAVGDVHGRADLLAKLLKTIEGDIKQLPEGQRATIVFLGDYIDRGFHSKEVIEMLLSLKIPDVELVFLVGNHEDMLLRFLEDPADSQVWLRVGGLAALASYGVYLAEDADLTALIAASDELSKKMPESHVSFLRGLVEHHREGDYYFVHAGVRPGIPLEAQRRTDKLGIRREFTTSSMDFGYCVVHGHSGVRAPERHRNRIAIDTGAFATGVLSAVALTEREVRFLSTT